MKWISSEEKKNLIYFLVLHSPLVYLSLAAAMGAAYTEEEGAGPLYKVFSTAIFVLGVFPVIKMILKNRCNKKVVPPILVALIYMLFAFIHMSFDENNFFLQLVFFSLPAICVALTIDKKQGLAGIMKWFDVFLPILAFSFVFLIRNIVLVKMTGESSYGQNVSYFAAYCFVVDVHLLRYKELYSSFRILQNKWYSIFKLLLLPYFFAICIFGGGRGALVLLVICIISNFDLLKKVSIESIVKVSLFATFISVLVVVLIGKAGEYFDILISGFDRVTILFNGGKLDASASSGRDYIWHDALNTWSLSPLYGYGLFSYLDHFYIRPHNVFLEIMLQGGLILLLLFLIILIRSFFKYRNMLKIDKTQIFLIPYILYISTLLLFSGSYWMESFFWFVLTYIYAYNFKSVEIVRTKT